MLKEFKEFISKGNIFDMAIGVIIGGAFQKIVTSLVNDIIMPLISVLTKNVNFSHLSATVGTAQITYGNFISEIVNFFIIALSIFIAIHSAVKLNKKLSSVTKKNKKSEKTNELTTKSCPYCYSEINIKATKCPNCTSALED